MSNSRSESEKSVKGNPGGMALDNLSVAASESALNKEFSLASEAARLSRATAQRNAAETTQPSSSTNSEAGQSNKK
jgi:hypothetical protein